MKSRYENDLRMNLGFMMGTPEAVSNIRKYMKLGAITSTTILSTGDDRLDVLAGQIYGNSSLWWVLAAASNIGWGLQVPPGTVIRVPLLSDVMKVM